ncbi:MAG TPA: ATP12 family protein [Caulobacteraceae bacterium]
MSARGYKEPGELPRRFYKVADVAAEAGGYAVRLDGRTPRSPAGKPLVLPTQALAALAAGEWAAQGEHLRTDTMPATRLANTALDRVSQARAEVAGEVARYAGSELLCYRAGEPLALVERQARDWQPLLDWAADELGVALEAVEGIVHCEQPAASLARVEALAGELDDFTLAGLAHATALFGSAVLGLALQRGRLGGEAAFALSRLDEAFQEELWGVDAEAAERTERLAAEAVMLERWFAALR